MGDEDDKGSEKKKPTLEAVLGFLKGIGKRTKVTITASNERSEKTYEVNGMGAQYTLTNFLGVLGFYDEPGPEFAVEHERTPGKRGFRNKVSIRQRGKRSEGYRLDITYREAA